MSLAVQLLALAASPRPQQGVLFPPQPQMNCVSTSVDIKSAWCVKACNAAEKVALTCPFTSCLCVASPETSERYAQMSKNVLLRLAGAVHKSPAAEKPAQMQAARETAALVVKALAKKPAPAKGGKHCMSTKPDQISDEWCVDKEATFPLICYCEDGDKDGSSAKSKQLSEADLTPKEWINGYYSWSWTQPGYPPNNGTLESNLGVQFSGEEDVTRALKAVGAISDPCSDTSKTWCDSQLDFYKKDAESEDEAKQMVLKDFGETCRSCIVKTEDYQKAWARPFSTGWRGKQFLSLGGSRSIEAWRVEFLDGLVDGGEEIDMIKHAGFTGVCFDIEETSGGMELVEAFERAFKALKKSGLEVMITTSHSAPYSADTDEIRIAFVESWIKSPDVDYISPQLYTSGSEGSPEMEPSSGTSGPVNYEKYYQNMPAWKKFVPSVNSVSHVDEMKKTFNKKGVRVDGFVQWVPVSRDPASAVAVAAPEAPTAPVAPTVPGVDTGAAEAAVAAATAAADAATAAAAAAAAAAVPVPVPAHAAA